MNYIEVEGYYSTLNLVIELFEGVGLPKYHLERIFNLSEIVESYYNGILLDKFCRDPGESISEEEFTRGMLLNHVGELILDDEGCSSPDPTYSILHEAKKRSVLKLVNRS